MASDKTILSRLRNVGERKMTDLANELLSNPKFATALGKTIQKAMETKGRVDKNVQLVLSAINMPTKSDYDRLVNKVNALSKNINEIDLRIDALIKKMESQHAARPAAKTAGKKAAPKKAAPKKAAPKKTAKKKAPSGKKAARKSAR